MEDLTLKSKIAAEIVFGGSPSTDQGGKKGGSKGESAQPFV